MVPLKFQTYKVFFISKLCNKNQQYKFSKSTRETNKSFYFKHRFKPTIRISNHHLHPKQERFKIIDLVIISKKEIYINKKPIIIPENVKQKKYKSIFLEYIALENFLYKTYKKTS